MTKDMSEKKDRTLLYIVGDLPGIIAEVLSDRFHIETYKGELEANVMIVSASEEAQRTARGELVNQAWEKGAKIVLLYPSESEVRWIREILKIDRELTANAAIIEYLGIKRKGENVTKIEIEGSIFRSREDADKFKLGRDVNVAGTDGGASGFRRVYALEQWLKAPVLYEADRVQSATGLQSLDFTQFDLGTRFIASQHVNFSCTTFGMGMYSVDQGLYWVSYWIEFMYNPEPGRVVEFFEYDNDKVFRRCVGLECPPHIPGLFVHVDHEKMRNRLIMPSPPSTPPSTVSVQTSTETTITGAVTVGFGGIDITYSHGVTNGRARTIDVPPLQIVPGHELRLGLPTWRLNYQAAPQGTQQVYMAWVNSFLPVEIHAFEGRRDILMEAAVRFGGTSGSSRWSEGPFNVQTIVPLPGIGV